MHIAALASFIPSWAHSPWMIAIAIVLATFVHEDLATIATGMFAAQGKIAFSTALPALYLGIVLGDLGLYCLGYLVSHNRLSKSLIATRNLAKIKPWLDRHAVIGVFVVRFLPGLRLSAYTACGFFSMAFGRFVLSVLLAASIWTTGLFTLSYRFGAATEAWLGFWRWPALLVAVIVPLFILRRVLQERMALNRSADKIP